MKRAQRHTSIVLIRRQCWETAFFLAIRNQTATETILAVKWFDPALPKGVTVSWEPDNIEGASVNLPQNIPMGIRLVKIPRLTKNPVNVIIHYSGLDKAVTLQPPPPSPATPAEAGAILRVWFLCAATNGGCGPDDFDPCVTPERGGNSFDPESVHIEQQPPGGARDAQIYLTGTPTQKKICVHALGNDRSRRK